MKTKKMKPIILDELSDTTVKKYLLKAYKKEIRDNYYIVYVRRVSPDTWVVKLERTLDSYNTFEEDK